jgi:hypothetical protein
MEDRCGRSRLVSDRPTGKEITVVTDRQIQEFLDRAAEDDDFAAELEGDAVATLRGSGFDELADEAVREEERLAAIATRIAEDEGFRARIEDNPAAALGGELPEPALEAFLAAVGAPDDLVERARGDVEAHIAAGTKASAAAISVAVLGALALGQQASAAQPGAVRYGEPSGFRYSAEPNPLRWSTQPNPIKWGAQPNPIKWGAQPGGIRWSKAGWQALRLQASRFNG